jgi:collagen type II alpha
MSTGSQGVQGIQGIQGSQGIQGATGIQGPQGIQGPEGGPTGPTGPAGDVVAGASLIPSADITYDLGSPSFRWRDLYLGPTSLHIGNATLSADVDGNLFVRNAIGATGMIGSSTSGGGGNGATGPTGLQGISGFTGATGQQGPPGTSSGGAGSIFLDCGIHNTNLSKVPILELGTPQGPVDTSIGQTLIYAFMI